MQGGTPGLLAWALLLGWKEALSATETPLHGRSGRCGREGLHRQDTGAAPRPRYAAVLTPHQPGVTGSQGHRDLCLSRKSRA